jgi:hypothetical protein
MLVARIGALRLEAARDWRSPIDRSIDMSIGIILRLLTRLWRYNVAGANFAAIVALLSGREK